MPFGFLKRSKDDAKGDPKAGAAAGGTGRGLHSGAARGVAFTALTEDWRLTGLMQITGRLSDALNKREAIGIADVTGARRTPRRSSRRRASRAWTPTTSSWSPAARRACRR